MPTLIRIMGLRRKRSVCPEMGKARFQRSSSPNGVLRRTPRAAVLSKGPQDAATTGGKAGKPSLSEGCRAVSAQPGGQLLFQTSQVSSVGTSCRKKEITQLCNTHCTVKSTYTSNKCAHTIVYSRGHTFLHGVLCRSLPAVAPGAPKTQSITCRCNQNPVRDYASG